MSIISVEPGNSEQAEAVAREAARWLADGGLVVFPTETVYGVGASARSEAGLAKLRQVKGGGARQTYTVHVSNPRDAGRYADLSDRRMSRLIEKLLAGPVTVRLLVDDQVIVAKLGDLAMDGQHRDRIYAERTVALRCPNHEITKRLLSATDHPVIAGAAAGADQGAPHDVDQAVAQVGDRADYVLDGGPCRFAKGSTLVDVRTDHSGWPVVRVLREGVYDERTIRRLARFTVLTVCSGNTCRSPIAEALAGHMLAQRRGLSEEELDAAGLRVISAGLTAVEGAPASAEGAKAMQQRGLDLSNHHSRLLTRELVREADLIFAMTDTHLSAIHELAPDAANRTFRLDGESDISDPIGLEGGTEVYERTAQQIERALDQRFTELGL